MYVKADTLRLGNVFLDGGKKVFEIDTQYDTQCESLHQIPLPFQRVSTAAMGPYRVKAMVEQG